MVGTGAEHRPVRRTPDPNDLIQLGCSTNQYRIPTSDASSVIAFFNEMKAHRATLVTPLLTTLYPHSTKHANTYTFSSKKFNTTFEHTSLKKIYATQPPLQALTILRSENQYHEDFSTEIQAMILEKGCGSICCAQMDRNGTFRHASRNEFAGTIQNELGVTLADIAEHMESWISFLSSPRDSKAMQVESMHIDARWEDGSTEGLWMSARCTARTYD